MRDLFVPNTVRDLEHARNTRSLITFGMTNLGLGHLDFGMADLGVSCWNVAGMVACFDVIAEGDAMTFENKVAMLMCVHGDDAGVDFDGGFEGRTCFLQR